MEKVVFPEVCYEQAKLIVEGAFYPLKCHVVTDYKRPERLELTDEDGVAVFCKEFQASLARRREVLRSFIELCRAELKNRGFILDPWQMPTDSRAR